MKDPRSSPGTSSGSRERPGRSEGGAPVGRGFGMGTVRLRAVHDDRSEHPEADAVADSHAQLLELLGERVR